MIFQVFWVCCGFCIVDLATLITIFEILLLLKSTTPQYECRTLTFFCPFKVQVVHVDGAAKNAADDKLKQLMTKFSKIVKYPATVLLISSDVNFSPILSELKHTSKFRIILLHNANASKDLLSFAHEARRFDHFTADLPLNHTRQVQVRNFYFCWGYHSAICFMHTF